MTRFGIAALFFMLFSLPVIAQESWEEALRHLGADEIRAGLVMDQIELQLDARPLVDPSSIDLRNTSTISFDVLFRSPEIAVFQWLGSPRPVVGVHLNLVGRESMVHAGLNWHCDLPVTFRTESVLFIEGELGGAVHNGYAQNPPPGFRDTGSNVLFYFGYGIGLRWNRTESVLLSLQHGSNAGLSGHAHNQGLNYLGLRYGHKL